MIFTTLEPQVDGASCQVVNQLFTRVNSKGRCGSCQQALPKKRGTSTVVLLMQNQHVLIQDDNVHVQSGEFTQLPKVDKWVNSAFHLAHRDFLLTGCEFCKWP
jgi:hypothetical protein